MAIASMPSATRRCGRRADLGGIERRQHVAVAIHALRHFEAVAARHERVGELQEQVVDVVALLGAHLEDVAEAARGDQAEARAAALDQGVGDERGAVHDVADVGEGQIRRIAAVRSRPSSAPIDGSCGVVRHLCRRMSLRCVSSRMKSVKVPPMSKPMR